jgi:PAS domain S-box-containing protein
MAGFNHRKQEIIRARENALLLVQSLAAQQEQIAISTKYMLSTLAYLPEVRNNNIDACNQLFKELNSQNLSYSVIASTNPNGDMIAASVSFVPGSINLSDRKHIQDVIKTLNFSAGEYIVLRTSGAQSINYAYPVLDAHKNLIGIVIAGFNLDEYARFMKKVNLPEGSAVTIADHAGVRLFRYPPNDAAPPGGPLPAEVAKLMMGTSEQGIFERVGQDGIERIYAFRPLYLHENTSPYLYMGVGIPKDPIVQKANLEMARSLSILGVLCLCAMSLAWAFGHTVLLKPIHHLVTVARRLGGGELYTRTGLRHSPDELGRLAQSFDDMASLLEQRNWERAKTEELLRNAREKYRNIFENALGGIFTSTPEGRFMDANRALAQTLGYASPEELKDLVTDIHHQVFADPARYLECIQAVLDRGEADFEIEIRKKDGTTGWVSTRVRVVHDDRGEVSHFEGVAEDITERKFAEKELKLQSLVLGQIHDHVIVTDLEGRITHVNESACRTLGKSREELIGQSVQCLGEEHSRGASQREIIEQTLARGEWHGEVVNYASDGREVLLDCRTRLVRDEQGRTVAMCGVSSDITEPKAAQAELEKHRKHLEDLVKERTCKLLGAVEKLHQEVREREKVEDTLRRSEEKLRSFIETTSDWVWEIDKDGVFTYSSSKVSSVLGYEPHEVLGRAPWDLMPPEDRENACDSFSRLVLAPQSLLNFENLHVHKDGRRVVLETSGVPLQDSEGAFAGYRGINRDITGRKRIENQLRESENLYRTLFEITGTVMVLIEEDTTISLVNAQFERLLGCSKDEVEGRRSWTEFVLEDKLEQYRTYHFLRRIDPESAPKQYEMRLIDRAGNVRDTVITVGMIPGTKRSVASLLDITEQKQTERALQQSVAELNTLQTITRKLLQQEELASVMRSITEGIVLNIGYDVALAARYLEKERVLTGFVLHPPHLESVMREVLGHESEETLWERKLKCDGRNSVLERVLKGEVIMGDSLSPFVAQWVSPSGARELQDRTGRVGYIALPMRVKGQTVGVILAGWNASGHDCERMKSALGRVADQAAVAVKSAGLFECVRSQREELRALTAKLQKAQEDERKKLAQELHDRVGQNLTGLSINLGIIRSRLLPECMERVESRIADCVGLVGSTMECIRDVMAELHPPGLTEYGLSAALKYYCNQLARRTGMRVSVQCTETIVLSHPESEIALFRIAQEALTNAVRHSRAHEVKVSLQAMGEKLVLCIADDGVGFEQIAQTSLTEGSRFGLINMRERAEAAGGAFRVDSAPGRGTKVIIEINPVIS